MTEWNIQPWSILIIFIYIYSWYDLLLIPFSINIVINDIYIYNIINMHITLIDNYHIYIYIHISLLMIFMVQYSIESSTESLDGQWLERIISSAIFLQPALGGTLTMNMSQSNTVCIHTMHHMWVYIYIYTCNIYIYILHIYTYTLPQTYCLTYYRPDCISRSVRSDRIRSDRIRFDSILIWDLIEDQIRSD